nr:ribonuclease HIII [bacterium]
VLTSYSCALDTEQLSSLKGILEARNFVFKPLQYGFFQAAGDTVSIAAYRTGKVLIQGKGTRDFIEFVLEPEVLKEIRLGYEEVLGEEGEERIGVDESGKGDYFGPLVVAGVYITPALEKKLREAGVKDSKKISDRRVMELRKLIRRECINSVVAIGPERYNQLYPTMGNLNKILAWGHARVIENILGKVPCRQAVLDQFGHKDLVLSALMKKGRNIEVAQRFRGEEDISVAAGSILARAEFILRLGRLSEEFGIDFPKGNGKKNVIPAAKKMVKKNGLESLVKVAKIHFKTTREVMLS